MSSRDTRVFKIGHLRRDWRYAPIISQLLQANSRARVFRAVDAPRGGVSPGTPPDSYFVIAESAAEARGLLRNELNPQETDIEAVVRSLEPSDKLTRDVPKETERNSGSGAVNVLASVQNEIDDLTAIRLFKEDPVRNFDVLRNRRISGRVDLSYNEKITSLPEGLEVGGWLDLWNCTSLVSLPKVLVVGGYLRLWNCASLTSLSEVLTVGDNLSLYGCTSLTSLPERLEVGGNIYLNGCTKLKVWLVKERKIEWLRRKVEGKIEGLI